MSGLVWFGFFILLFISPFPCFVEKISINFEVLERAACFWGCQTETNDLCFELPKKDIISTLSKKQRLPCLFLFAAFGSVAVGHELQDGSNTGLSCRALPGESITANLNSAAGCHLIPQETVCISSCNRLCEFKNLPWIRLCFQMKERNYQMLGWNTEFVFLLVCSLSINKYTVGKTRAQATEEELRRGGKQE